MSKRHIRWRWGFANAEEINKGTKGVQCRGAEHEVTLIWSITGGKQHVVEDGKEIHYAGGNRVGKFQYCWASHNDHIFTIIAHATPPIGKQDPGWKQFDLLVDGMSFDNLPHIYELGLETYRGPHFRYNVHSVEHRSDENATREVDGSDSHWNRPSFDNAITRETRNVETERKSDNFKGFRNDTDIEPVDLLSGQDFFDAPFESNIPPIHPSTKGVNISSPSESYADISNLIMDAYDKSESSLPPSKVCVTSLVNQSEQARKSLQVETSFCDSVHQTSTGSPRCVSNFDETMNNLVNLQDLAKPVTNNGSRPSIVCDQERTLLELKNDSCRSESSKNIMKHVVASDTNAVVVHKAHQAYNNYSAPSGFTIGY